MAHRKTVRHFHEAGHLHEFTFSCYHRMPLLSNDTWRERLARCVEAAGKETAIELVGFVFMPEQVHLLVYPTTPNPSISLYLARIKQPFSKQIKQVLAERGSRLLSKLTVRARSVFGFGKKGRVSTGIYFLPTRFRRPWSISTTILSTEGFVVVPWTGNGRRPDTTSMFPHDNSIPACH